jgi:hypothetical protein
MSSKVSEPPISSERWPFASAQKPPSCSRELGGFVRVVLVGVVLVELVGDAVDERF